MYEDEYGSNEREMEVSRTRSQDAQRTSLCHNTHLDTHLQMESRPLQNNLAPYFGDREGNGGLEVLGGSKSSG